MNNQAQHDDVLGFEFSGSNEKSIIKVIGVGGGGSNAVNHMFRRGIKGVEFVVCNTDNQALAMSPIPTKVQLGRSLTEGRGAGSIPDVGRKAAEESQEEIRQLLSDGTKMVFITAGMGGGTGTGAAPVIAKQAKDMGILTVGIVTLPFLFEGKRRMDYAKDGLELFKSSVDTLLVISNNQLRQMYGNLGLTNAFGKADDILTAAAKGIAEIITVPGYVNVDFEDVKTVMTNGGNAVMGSSIKEGENRAQLAAEEVLISPLLDDSDISGAQHMLLYISHGNQEPLLDELSEITEYIQDAAGKNASLIWGTGYDETLGDALCLTLIATGFDRNSTTSVSNETQILELTRSGALEIQEELLKEKFKVNPLDEAAVSVDTPELEVTTIDLTADVTEPQMIDLDPLEDMQPQASVEEENNGEVEVLDLITGKKVDAPMQNKKHDVEEFLKNSNSSGPRVAPPKFKSYEDRKGNLENFTSGLRRPSELQLIDRMPAFQRRNVSLIDTPSASDRETSNLSLGKNNDIQKNRFLHDSVD
jgi:cell division protein FtsZ